MKIFSNKIIKNIIEGAAGAIVAGLILYYIFNIGTLENSNDKIKIYSPQNMLNSQNWVQIQGDVNLGVQPRTITKEISNELIESLNKNQNIKITIQTGNWEVLNFANQISDFLIRNGYVVDEITSGVFPVPDDALYIQNRSEIFISSQ